MKWEYSKSPETKGKTRPPRTPLGREGDGAVTDGTTGLSVRPAGPVVPRQLTEEPDGFGETSCDSHVHVGSPSIGVPAVVEDQVPSVSHVAIRPGRDPKDPNSRPPFLFLGDIRTQLPPVTSVT